MPSGGPRAGSGRPRGSVNKAIAERQARVAASGITPLDYMLGVMRDEAQELGVRLDAAKSVAPYVHPRLASVDQRLSADDSFREFLSRIAANGQRLAQE